MKSLFQINEEYLTLTEELVENGGELTEDLAVRLKVNKEEIAPKLHGYYHIIRMTEGEVEVLDREIKRLTALKKARTNTIEALKNNVLAAVVIHGTENKKNVKELKVEHEGTVINFSIRKSVSTEITDEKLLPDEYVVVTRTPSKTLIKEALDAGKVVPGAQLSANQNLKIS